MTLPASEDTRDNLMCFIEINTDNAVIRTVADQDYTAGDFAIWGPYCGIIASDVLTGARATITVKDGIRVSTSNVNTGSTFTTPGEEVWYDAINDEFTDAEAAGLYGVGPLAEDIDSDGVIKFYKRRYYLDGEDT